MTASPDGDIPARGRQAAGHYSTGIPYGKRENAPRRQAGAALLVLAELLWLGLLTWKVWSQPVPVTFDMRGTVDTFTTQTAEQHLSDDEKARLVTRFNDALTQSLADWSDVHHQPVMVKAAVVSGLDDITADIQRDIARRMRQGGQ